MSEKLRNGKRRILTETETKAVVDQWVDIRSEEELDQQIVKNEIKKMENKLAIYNVLPVGYMEEDKKEGMCRIVYSRLNSASTSTLRQVKMDRVHKLNENDQVDVIFCRGGIQMDSRGRQHIQ